MRILFKVTAVVSPWVAYAITRDQFLLLFMALSILLIVGVLVKPEILDDTEGAKK